MYEMKRLDQIVLIGTFIGFSWLAMQVVHELGHVLGFEDLDPEADDLMSATLDAGVRYLPEDTFAGQAQNNSESLISLDLTPDESDADDALDSLINDNPWLIKYLLDGAEEEDPNSDIAVVINNEDLQNDDGSSAENAQTPSDDAANGNGKGKKK